MTPASGTEPRATRFVPVSPWDPTGTEDRRLRYYYYMLAYDMTIVGTGPDEMPICYLSGVGNNYPKRGRAKDAATRDEAGIRSCQIVERRATEEMLQG